MEQGGLHKQLSFIVEGPVEVGAKWRKLAFIFLYISNCDAGDAALGGLMVKG